MIELVRYLFHRWCIGERLTVAMDARAAPAANELLVRPQAVSDSADRQLRLFIDGKFHRFDQWKSSKKYQRNSSLVHLRQSLDQLLPLVSKCCAYYCNRVRDYQDMNRVCSMLAHWGQRLCRCIKGPVCRLSSFFITASAVCSGTLLFPPLSPFCRSLTQYTMRSVYLHID